MSVVSSLERIARRIAENRASARNFASHVYAVVLSIVLGASAIAAALFVAAIAAGGAGGAFLASLAEAVLRWCMIGAVAAVWFGMINVYLSGRHSLTLDDAQLADSGASRRGEREAGETVGG